MSARRPGWNFSVIMPLIAAAVLLAVGVLMAVYEEQIYSAQQVKSDPHEAVDCDLGHHPAHQRGDVAGRSGMRERQPGMQRHHAGLRPCADQRQQQGQRCDAR